MPNSRRTTLILRAEALKAVEKIHESRGDTLTEAVNRSLVLYRTLLEYVDKGGEIHITCENDRDIILKIL